MIKIVIDITRITTAANDDTTAMMYTGTPIKFCHCWFLGATKEL
jgi:hypothetical protein